MITSDFLIVGAGIAGASAAHELAAHGSVTVLEREPQPGYHSTGRSAAQFTEIYGNAVIRALSRASRAFLFSPPAGFTDVPLVRDRGVLYIASASQREAFETFCAEPDVARVVEYLSTNEVLSRVPVLRPESVVHAAFEPKARDVDVHALHQAYLRGLKSRGGTLVRNVEVTRIERRDGHWCLFAAEESYGAPVLIDAAGAWADEFARLAGVTPLQLEPRRRTAVVIDPPDGLSVADWPMVIDAEETFYFKPDAHRLLLSPADETPSPPCDVQPEDLDVAVAVERVEQATTLRIDRVKNRWAGLRSFVRDRSPVVGFDPEAPGFFWLAGQGGYGIQTAPAMARATSLLARRLALDEELRSWGVDAAALSPARLRS